MEHIRDGSARRPTKLTGITEHKTGPMLTLSRHRFGAAKGAVGKVFGVEPDFTLRLDRYGAHVWGQIDGATSLRDILVGMKVEFPNESDLAKRLGTLIGLLASKGFIELP